jgi:hypothetical protein
MSSFVVRLNGSVPPDQHEAIHAEHTKLVTQFAELDQNAQGTFGTDQTDGSGYTAYSISVTGQAPQDINEQVKAEFEAALQAVRAIDPHVVGSYRSSDSTGDVAGTGVADETASAE